MITSPSEEELQQNIKTKIPAHITDLDERMKLSFCMDVQEQLWYGPEYVERQSLQEEFPNLQRVAVFFNKELPDINDENGWVLAPIAELINNCTDKGATAIWVIYSPETKQIIVRDNFLHKMDEIEELLANLNSEKVTSTKPNFLRGGYNCGIGISSTREKLRRIGGSLRYYAVKYKDDSSYTILALIDW